VAPRRAAFLDRDGTLIADAHYLSDAARIRVLDGAIDAVRTLHGAGVAVVVVTNQSGIGRGLITEEQYQRTRERVEELFAAAGAPIDATFHCPHDPERGPCSCRKPGTGMYLQAARELDLVLEGSLVAGDRRRDVEPATSFGGVGILIPSGETSQADIEWARENMLIAPALADAIALSGLTATGARHDR
jgi:D-glycero-D-manno-heptose 1,7-bisphosphate phosphatase